MKSQSHTVVLTLIANLIELDRNRNITIRKHDGNVLETRIMIDGKRRDTKFILSGDDLVVNVLFTTDGGRSRNVRCVLDLLNVQVADYYDKYITGDLFNFGVPLAADALQLLFMFFKDRGIKMYITHSSILGYAVVYKKQLEMLVAMQALPENKINTNSHLYLKRFNEISNYLNTMYSKLVSVEMYNNLTEMRITPAGCTVNQDQTLLIRVRSTGIGRTTSIVLPTSKRNVSIDITLVNGSMTSLKDIYDEVAPYILTGLTTLTMTHIDTFMNVFKTPIYHASNDMTLNDWSMLVTATPLNVADKSWMLSVVGECKPAVNLTEIVFAEK